MDLDDVERRTKIRKKYLEALEDGDWSVLPGEVYARGFVRSYAECVGLDGLELLEKYIDQPHVESLRNPGKLRQEPTNLDKPKPMTESITERPITEFQGPNTHMTPSAHEAPTTRRYDKSNQDDKSKQNDGVPYVPPSTRNGPNATKPRSRERRGPHIGSFVGQGAAVLVAFAVLAGAWWAIRGHHGTTPQVAAGNASQNVAVASNAAGSTNANTASNQATNAPVQASTGNSTNTSNSASGQAAPSSTTISVQPYNAATGTLTVVDTSKGPLVLNATAQGGQCWTQVLADGKSVDPNDFIVPGTTKSWSATQELRIDLGNVPVVSLTVNGQAVPLPNVTKPIWVVIKKQA